MRVRPDLESRAREFHVGMLPGGREPCLDLLRVTGLLLRRETRCEATQRPAVVRIAREFLPVDCFGFTGSAAAFASAAWCSVASRNERSAASWLKPNASINPWLNQRCASGLEVVTGKS